MFYLLFILPSFFIQQDSIDDRFIWLENNIDSFVEVESVNEIPNNVIKSISKWRMEKIVLQSNPKRRFEKRELKKYNQFKIYDFPQKKRHLKHLIYSPRIFDYASYYNQKWIITYKHSQGAVSNIKTIFFDIKNKNNTLIFYGNLGKTKEDIRKNIIYYQKNKNILFRNIEKNDDLIQVLKIAINNPFLSILVDGKNELEVIPLLLKSY